LGKLKKNLWSSRRAVTASLDYTDIYISYIVKSLLKGIFKEKVYLKNGYLIAAVGHHSSLSAPRPGLRFVIDITTPQKTHLTWRSL